MPRENVEIVRRLWEAYLARDEEAALALIHPEAEIDFSVRVDSGIGRGPEALSRAVTTWLESWDDFEESIDDIEELGDKVCVIATQRGRGRGSGLSLDSQFVFVYEFENGLITRVTTYNNRDDAVAAEESRS